MPESTPVAVKDSILQSIKKLLGLDADFTAYDLDITIHINSAFSTLYQAGVGPLEGFFITDSNDKWDRFTGNKIQIQDVKSYVFLKVRLLFDPPSTSYGIDASKAQVDEYIWRLNVADDFSYLPAAVVPETPTALQASFWDLTGGLDFPLEAAVGDFGIDTTTGDVWRNT